MLLSRLPDAKIKDHNLFRLKNPDFLMHHFAVDHPAVHFKEETQDGMWPTFSRLLAVNLFVFPPDGSQACCLLLELTLQQQVAQVTVRHNIWTILTLQASCLFDIQHSWIKKNQKSKEFREINGRKVLILMSVLQVSMVYLMCIWQNGFFFFYHLQNDQNDDQSSEVHSTALHALNKT